MSTDQTVITTPTATAENDNAALVDNMDTDEGDVFDQVQEIECSATYSAEDNKLRLYSSTRLDAETYQLVKNAGFKWAPKQELFVAPMWTPAREDLLVQLAGVIVAEESTMLERAEAKAARLDNLSAKRTRESGAYQNAANEISRRFEGGQPILVGHHSERKARKDQSRMHSAMDRALKASKAAQYWLYKADGAELHAIHKNRDAVRARRIQTLLADLRTWQRSINDTHKTLNKLLQVESQQDNVLQFNGAVEFFAGNAFNLKFNGEVSLWVALSRGMTTHAAALQQLIACYSRCAVNPNPYRWVRHILGRLNYERSHLGTTERFDGTLTPVIIQAFARENGADKPSATQTNNGFTLESGAPLPAHIGQSNVVEFTVEEWKDLMESCGYEVPDAKPTKAPLLNFSAETVALKTWSGKVQTYKVFSMTKAQHASIYEGQRGVKYSSCGTFRVRFCVEPGTRGYNAPWVVAFITDSKAHPAPQSAAVNAQATTGDQAHG